MIMLKLRQGKEDNERTERVTLKKLTDFPKIKVLVPNIILLFKTVTIFYLLRIISSLKCSLKVKIK